MRILTTITGLFLAGLLFGQGTGDKVLGKWYTPDKETILEVYKESGKYFGKIVWLKEPNEEDGTPKVDDKNPEPKLQSRHILGLVNLNDFIYDAKEKEWSDGKIYDPKNGKTYDCYMWMDNDDELTIKGYIMGMRWLGRKETWTRAK
jgi:uncharacterized protein (DUF2147 family)